MDTMLSRGSRAAVMLSPDVSSWGTSQAMDSGKHEVHTVALMRGFKMPSNTTWGVDNILEVDTFRQAKHKTTPYYPHIMSGMCFVVQGGEGGEERVEEDIGLS